MSKFFLYNGVELPGLPEWDKTRYPYAFIYIVTLDGTTGVYTLVMTSSNVMSYDGNGIICTAANVGQRYTVSGEEWVAAAGSDDFYIKRDNLIFTVWANFDVLNSDGSVYVAASEPVPVAGKFPLREWVGWLIAGLCSRPLPVSAREPVAYLYNGVRLTPLPEWDKVNYPYAFIENIAGVDSDTPKWQAIFTKNPLVMTDAETGIMESTDHFVFAGYDNGVWSPVIDSPIFSDAKTYSRRLLWANHDILSSDGSVYLAASDPIPVYE